MLPEMKLWGTATVGSKGQVVIPAEARDELGIGEGDKMVVLGSTKLGTVTLVKAEAIEQMMTSVQANLLRIKNSTTDQRSEDE